MPTNETHQVYSEAPRTDIYENQADFLLLLDLSGVSLKDLSIQSQQDQLTIEGRRDEQFRYRRSFTMPSRVETDKISAQFKNGVLEVRIPKSEEVKPRAIEVTSA
jgi:HSP20 family protein